VTTYQRNPTRSVSPVCVPPPPAPGTGTGTGTAECIAYLSETETVISFPYNREDGSQPSGGRENWAPNWLPEQSPFPEEFRGGEEDSIERSRGNVSLESRLSAGPLDSAWKRAGTRERAGKGQRRREATDK